LLLLHLVGCLYYCIRDARSHEHQICERSSLASSYNGPSALQDACAM